MFCILEAKIDLGYLDSGWAESRKETFRQLKAVGKVSIGRKKFNVSERLCSAGILLTGRNHPERLPNFVKEVENAVIFLLKDYAHPNDKFDRKARKVYIEKISKDESHRQEWQRFERFVQDIARI